MEEDKSSMSKYNKLKDYKNGWRATNEVVGELSWPPKSYNCSFCKREFRSAQALGGHMNVHRREKARLRQITPYLHPQFQLLSSSNSKFLHLKLTSNPNPNPDIKTLSIPKMLTPFTYSCCLPFSNSCHLHGWSTNFSTLRSRESNLIGDGFDADFSDDEKERMIVKKSKSSDLFAELKFDHALDLELRLGCS